MLAAKGKRMMGWNEITGDKLHEYQSDADTEGVKQELASVRSSISGRETRLLLGKQ